MKYFFSLLLSIAIISVATAQDFKKVETNVYLKKFEEAKTEIDKSMADPKNQAKADGYYWKSRIYAALFQNEATRAKYPNAVEDAHAAFQKYAEMDPALAKVKEKESLLLSLIPEFEKIKEWGISRVRVFESKESQKSPHIPIIRIDPDLIIFIR